MNLKRPSGISLKRKAQKYMKKVFMVEFEMPETFSEEFVALIPRQRYIINQLLAKRIIHSYSLATDRSRLWVVVNAESEWEVMDILSQMPLNDYMKPHINELMFHNSAEAVLHFSLN